MDNKSIKKLEADLWEAADLLRQGSKLTSQQYCMPVLGLLFLRYAFSRYKKVEEEIRQLIILLKIIIQILQMQHWITKIKCIQIQEIVLMKIHY